VCVPNGQPKCAECPLASICLARKRGLLDSIPYKAPKKPRKIEERTILVIESGDRIAIQKRPDHGLLASLYEFPNLEGKWTEKEIVQMLSETSCVRTKNKVAADSDEAGEAEKNVATEHSVVIQIERLADAKHIFSHVEWHMTGYLVKMDEIPQVYLSVHQEELKEKYPLPNAYAAYTKLIDTKTE
jgi:A/G-specific adenine glycosylase